MPKRLVPLVFALALPLLPVPIRAQATIGGEWRADVDRFAARVVEAGLVPGMAVAVSVGDWVLHSGRPTRPPAAP